MKDATTFDILLQFDQAVVKDLQIRSLNASLASQPLTFFPRSLPVGMQTEAKTSSEVLPVTQAVTSSVQKPESILLGLMLNTECPAPTTFVNLLSAQSPYNAALSISTSGLNALLAHLCQQGLATGKMHHSQWGDVNWQWEQLSVTLGQGSIQLAGILLQRGQRRSVRAEVFCLLDGNGILRCVMLSSNTDPAIAEIIRISWVTLMHRLLAVPEERRQARDPNTEGRLWQCFDIPGTQSSVEAPARDLQIVQGQLVIFYRIPKTQRKLQFEVPSAPPAFAISQTHIPRQVAPGAPVTVQLKATALRESAPPYTHMWTIGGVSKPTLGHGPEVTIEQRPKRVLRRIQPGQAQELTIVHLKTIDTFGQATEVPLSVQYIPYHKMNETEGKQLRLRPSIAFLLVLLPVIIFLLFRLPATLPSIFAHPLKPATISKPLLYMPAAIEPGKTFKLEGVNFPPHLRASIQIDPPSAPNNASSTTKPTGGEMTIAGTLSSLIMQKPAQLGTGEMRVTVDGNGKFTVMVPTGKDWLRGSVYTVRVLGLDRRQLASGVFQIRLETSAYKAKTVSSRPCMSVDQTSLPFIAEQGQAGNPAPQTVTIKNCGSAGTITAKADTSDGGLWLSTSGEGKLAASNQLGLIISVNIHGLLAGQYTGSVQVTLTDASGSVATQQVDVNLVITRACITIAPATLTFTAEQGANNPATQSFTINNCGDTGTVTAVNGASWLSSTGQGGTLNAGSQLTITVSVNSQGLGAGQYTGSVNVTLTNVYGVTHTATLNVNLTITPSPCISVQPTSLTFTTHPGANPASQNLTVSNCGNTAGTITTSVSDNRLSANAGMSLHSPGQVQIHVSVNAHGLAIGQSTYTLYVTLTDASGASTTVAVNVTLNVV